MLTGPEKFRPGIPGFAEFADAGLLCSTAFDAKMLALPLAFPHECSQSIILRISLIFSNPQYTENNFSGLLKIIAKYEVDKDIVCTLLVYLPS